MPKPLQLLEITVRPDWRELTQQAVVQRLRTWRAVQMAVAGATLVVLLAWLAFPSWPWHELLRVALFASLSWTLPLWSVLRSQQSIQGALERGLKPYLLLLAAIGVAYLTQPSLSANEGASTPIPWLELLALLIPCLTWPILRQTSRAFPVQLRRWGLVSDRWASNLAIGALAGCLLGLHLLLTTRFLFGQPQPAGPIGLGLVWMFCYQAGLMGLGQELLLRGLAYDALFAGARGFAVPAARIVLLNLLFYLPWMVLAPNIGLISGAGLLAYAAALSLGVTFLRHRQQSLLPGLAASVVFSLFTVPLFVA
jgi:hypothetical protein